MTLIAKRPLKLRTSTGIVDLKPGDPFRAKDPHPLIKEGIAEPISQEHFKTTFNKLAEHLRQRSYDKYNKKKLAQLAELMDKAWETLDYPTFRKVISEILKVPGILRAEGGILHATRIFSKVLGEEVWVCNSPEALSLVPEGTVIYLPEEIRNLRGATPEEIRQVHMIKRELGGRLIAVKERDANA